MDINQTKHGSSRGTTYYKTLIVKVYRNINMETNWNICFTYCHWLYNWKWNYYGHCNTYKKGTIKWINNGSNMVDI